MGLDINGTRFIFYAKKAGVNYSKTAMIGRQTLHLKPAELQKNLTEFGYSSDKNVIHSIFNGDDGSSEQLFRYLGADVIESFDNSSYEGATHIYDMNQEIPDTFKERYSVVLDGGSLEHIFNFPVAIKNCMEMVEVGGHYLGITPTNNLVGHGFYQLSPELYYSVFTIENGYKIIDVIAYETHNKKWFSVNSPLSIGGRVTLVNKNPTYLLVIAKRVEKKPIFESTPQQSDYAAAWKQEESALPTEIDPKLGIVNSIKINFSKNISRLIKNTKRITSKLTGKRHYSGFDPSYFVPIEPAKMHSSNKNE